MGREDALESECPHCKRFDRIVRATDVRQDASEAAVGGVDIALPAYESWSLLLVSAIGVLMLSAMTTKGAASPAVGNPVALSLTVAAMLLGALGGVRTRRNMARIRKVEPHVRHYHEAALYCENCARIHFPTRDLPPGLEPCVAWTFPDYRRRLWYSCGFSKSGFPV